MEGQLYIRMRGTVLGPYETERLQALVRRGQLSRLHEVSPDGLTWSPASNYPDLFVVASRPALQESPPAPPAPSASAGVAAPPPAPGVGQSGEQKWYYDHDGTQFGPIDLSLLQRMLSAGQVSADDMVWSDGMPAWIPAQHVPALFSACIGQVAGSPAGKSQRGEELPASLCKSATDSRPWVLFLGIIAFVFTALAVGLGLLALVAGANTRQPPIVAFGVFYLIYAGMAAAAGMYLTNYAARLGSLKYSPSPIILEKAHDVLRGFWIFISISLIVFLTLVALAVVVFIAVIGSFPHL